MNGTGVGKYNVYSDKITSTPEALTHEEVHREQRTFLLPIPILSVIAIVGIFLERRWATIPYILSIISRGIAELLAYSQTGTSWMVSIELAIFTLSLLGAYWLYTKDWKENISILTACIILSHSVTMAIL